MIEKVKLKKTKKFNEMTTGAKLAENLKMWFFADRVADKYNFDMGAYKAFRENLLKERGTTVSAYEAVLRRSLVEQQKLLAKYNCEDFITGHEIIRKDDKDYQKEIEPYKVKGGSWGVLLFQTIFKPLQR